MFSIKNRTKILTLIAIIGIGLTITFYKSAIADKPPTINPQPLTLNTMNPLKVSIEQPHNTQRVLEKPKEKEPQAMVATEDDNIVQCNDSHVRPSDQEERLLRSFFQSLADSSQPDNQLAYAIFAEPPNGQSRMDLLLSYHHQFPKNTLVVMDLVGMCSHPERHEHNACGQELLDSAALLDSNNGAMWLQIANYHASRQNQSATLVALEQAAKSPLFDEYFFHSLELFMQVADGTVMVDFRSTAAKAIGFHAAKPLYNRHILAFCDDDSTTSNEIAHLCLALGNQMEALSKIRLSKAMGLALQSIVYKAENNQAEVAMTQVKIDSLYASIKDKNDMKARTLMGFDNHLFLSWINDLIEHGEVVASKLLIKEAILLSKNPYYNPCRQ